MRKSLILFGGQTLALLMTPQSQSTVLQSTSTTTLTFAYSVSAGQLVVQLELYSNASALNSSWVSIGYGHGMLDAEFTVCSDQGDGTVAIQEYSNFQTYSPPPLNPGIWITEPIFGMTNGQSNLTCIFTRPLMPFDGYHANIDPSVPLTMVWAYTLAPVANYRNEKFSNHGGGQRGVVSLIMNSATWIAVPTQVFLTKFIHGVGMFVIWFFLFPLGI